jgi:inner membrane protein
VDPLTHALSGAVAMLALPKRPETSIAAPMAALAAAIPDLDILFISTPLDYLLIHRGLSHSLVGAPILGLAVALCARSLWSRATPGRWSLPLTWLFMTAMVLLHIWLDCVTTYGTMMFQPFSDYRVRLNGCFIVDLLLTLPLAAAVVWRMRLRRLVVGALIWTFLYPGASSCLSAVLAERTRDLLASEGRRIGQVVVLPDVLSPFFWRVIYEDESSRAEAAAEETGIEEAGDPGIMVTTRGLDGLGRPRTEPSAFPAVPPSMTRSLGGQSESCRAFLAFTLLPVVRPIAEGDMPEDRDEGRRYLLLGDLRYGTSLAFVQRLMSLRSNGRDPFQLMVELEGGEGWRLRRERMRFSGTGKDTGWTAPSPPTSVGAGRHR